MDINDVLAHHGTKGMKWGVRRYQNKDGSLTKAGQRRYDRDQKENIGRKKSERYTTADPDRWVRENLDRSRRLATNTSELTRSVRDLNNTTSNLKSRKRMNLSKMSDKEMRDKINRELLERQYNDVFNPKTVSKGRTYLNNTLNVAGNVATVTGSALGVALLIKELKGPKL